MEKILYGTNIHKDENIIWRFSYYITKETLSDCDKNLPYYGVMVTARSSNIKYVRKVTGIFPYRQDAANFAELLYKNQVTPISMQEIVVEYLAEKIISE